MGYSDNKFTISIYEEEDIILLSVGNMMGIGLEVRKALKKIGYSCSLDKVHSINQIDKEALSKACDSHRLIVTMEENSPGGSFGERVKDYLNSLKSPVSVLNISVPDECIEHDKVGLFGQEVRMDVDSIVKRIIIAYIGLGKDYRQ